MSEINKFLKVADFIATGTKLVDVKKLASEIKLLQFKYNQLKDNEGLAQELKDTEQLLDIIDNQRMDHKRDNLVLKELLKEAMPVMQRFYLQKKFFKKAYDVLGVN